MLNRRKLNVLRSIYYDVLHPASYGSKANLFKWALVSNKNITLEDVDDFLSRQDTYTLHKPRRVRFRRRKTIARHINHIWTVDLVHMIGFSALNDGYKYLLAVVDMFSRQAYVEPMKTKTAKATLAAFQNVLRRAGTRPNKIQADKGTEFYNSVFQRFLRTKRIHLYSTENETKASIVERYIRSLKGKIYRVMTAKNTQRYLPFLQAIVTSLNNRFHRTIGMAPAKVTKKNQTAVFDYQYGKYLAAAAVRNVAKYSIGDHVRISKIKKEFYKGYERNFTRAVFTIVDVLATRPVTYRLANDSGEVISGSFYEKELVRVAQIK